MRRDKMRLVNAGSAATDSAPKRERIFISYSHNDRRWLSDLKTVMAPSIRAQNLLPWDDTQIAAGRNWRREIETAIDSAKVAILLVSPDFLASRFIVDNELPPLLSAADQNNLTVLWVYVRASLYEETPIAKYQAAHDIRRPLDQLPRGKQFEVLKHVTKAIMAAMQ